MSVFYLDYLLGLDATTATPLGWWSVAFTGGTAPAPAGAEVVTGATSLSTAKVTVIGTLTGGSWAGGDAAGTMYFYGKSAAFVAEQVNFAGGGHMHIAADFVYCAWKTITAGPTAARIAPGDTIRIAKSPAPASIGNGTWTNHSKTVTLAAAQTLNIDLCEVAWTPNPAGDVTVALTAVATDGKEGANCMKFTTDAAVQVSIMQAYYATGLLNLAAYQKISFWIKNQNAIGDAVTWKICLCSDVAGAVVVDTFYIPAIPSVTNWVPLTLARSGGGNLGNAIQSIALWSDTTAPAASKYIYLDNIIACTTDGLNLQSLISLNSAEQGGVEAWHGLQSINGTTLMLDNNTNTKGNAGMGYGGATAGPLTTYKRETTKTNLATDTSTPVQSLQDSGTAALPILYEGGFDPATNLQDGETFFDGLNGFGHGGVHSNSKTFVRMAHVGMCRYYTGLYIQQGHSCYWTLPTLCNNYDGVFIANANGRHLFPDILNINNNGSGIQFSQTSKCLFTHIGKILSNTYYGVQFSHAAWNFLQVIDRMDWNAESSSYAHFSFEFSAHNMIGKVTTYGSPGNALCKGQACMDFILNATWVEPTIMNHTNGGACVSIENADGINHAIGFHYGLIRGQQATRHTASGIAWSLYPHSSYGMSDQPLSWPVLKLAVKAGTLVTVKGWMKKDHATNIACQLKCVGGQMAGPVADTVAGPKADDTNWQELTLTFVPAVAGVVEIVAEAWYVAGASYAYVDDMSWSQA